MISLRCTISYTWSEKHLSGGAVDFGIKSANDPKIPVWIITHWMEIPEGPIKEI